MKAFQRYTTQFMALTLASVGVLGLSLTSLGRFDLLAEPFGVLLIFGRAFGSIATLGMLYRWTTAKRAQLARVAVRA